MTQLYHQVWRRFDTFLDDCRVIAEDASGCILCGTSVGLTRFDGRRFESFGRTHGLWPDATVTAIAVAEGKRVWIGTQGGAVASWDGVRFSVFPGIEGTATMVKALLAEPDGTVLAGGDAGLHRVANDRLLRLSPSRVTSLLRDRRGYVWVGTDAGLFRLHDGRLIPPEGSHGLASARITALAEDNQTNLWIGSDKGITKFDGSKATTFTSEHGIPAANIATLTVDSRGLVWFGTIFAGAGCFDGHDVVSFTARNGLPHDHVVSIIEDHEGSIWVACLRGGIAQLDATGFAPVAAHPVQEAMAPSPSGTAWWGRRQTLVRLDGTTCRDCHSFHHPVLCILEDRQGRLWVGTGSELWRFPDARNPVGDSARPVAIEGRQIHCELWNLHEDARGTIWMADQAAGLHRYDEKLNAMVRVPEAATFGGCTNLTSDASGHVWLAGWNWRGAGFFDGSAVTRYTTAEGLADNCTMAVAVGRDGSVWVGTSHGLALLEGKRFRMYTVEDGLPGPFVQRLTSDRRGHLWIATLGGGVGRFDGKNFQVLTTEDGLPSNCVTGIVENSDGSMLFSTYSGVCRYIPDYDSAPQIRIDEVEGECVRAPAERLCIPDSSPALRIRYHGISLKTHRMRYTYILEGHDADWRATWDEEVRYEGLPTGSYTFRVIAVNRDLVYSKSAAVIRIDIVSDPKEEKLRELEKEVHALEGMLPICSVCKRIRNDSGQWEQMEAFIARRSKADFSHGYCPECAASMMAELAQISPPRRPPETAS